MACLKCGRDTEAENVFCQDCLETMERYPVKPGTLVLLPRRETAPKKQAKRRVPTPEEQVRTLKQRLRVRLILLLVCLGIIAALAYPAAKYLTGSSFKIGQNYSVIPGLIDTDK